MLVLTITKDLDKLLQNSGLTSIAALGELSGVVIMTIDPAIVLVIAVLRAKHSGTDGAGEVLNVILAVKCSNIGPTKCTATLESKKI